MEFGDINEMMKNMFSNVNFTKGFDMHHMLERSLQNMTVQQLFMMKRLIDAKIRSMGIDPDQPPSYARPNDIDDRDLNPFIVLGVDINCTEAELDSAYRSKANETHPDKGGTDEEFIKVHAAYETIKTIKGWC